MKRKTLPLLVLAAAVMMPVPLFPQATVSGNFWGEDGPIFELVGQVKNFSTTPPTSKQYGYLSYVKGVDNIFGGDGTASAANAKFTFYNESVTVRSITHGSLLVIIREGTTEIWYDETLTGSARSFSADPAVQANLNLFRAGTLVQTSTWRHQVVFDRIPLGGRTDLFFVNFWNTVTSADPFVVDGKQVRLGKVGDKFRIQLNGGPDATGIVNGKFAGVAVALGQE